MADLLILAHGGSWQGRFQISSLAASAAAAGSQVEIALFFGALESWVMGRWDALDPEPPLGRERLLASQAPILSELLVPPREAGRLRLYACSASVRFLGLDLARVQASVDAILGWQTFAQKIAESGRVVTL
ncbi:MAG: hypothetical protein U0002_06280 [Thermoanaerobaculia bacterium]